MRQYAIMIGGLLATGVVFIILDRTGVVPDGLGSGIAGFTFFAILIIVVYAYPKFQKYYSDAHIKESRFKPPSSDVLTRSILAEKYPVHPARKVSPLAEQHNPLTDYKLSEVLATTHSLIRHPHLDFMGSPLGREQRSAPRPATGLTPSASPARRIKPTQTGIETEEKRRRRDAETRLKTAPKELVQRAESLVARKHVNARSYLTYMVEREHRIYPHASSAELLKHIINLQENPPRYPSHTRPTYIPRKLSFNPVDSSNRISPWDFWNSRDFRDPPSGRRPGR